MQHDGITHIKPHMGNAGGVVGADEKHQIAGLGLLRCDGGTEVIKPLRRLPPDAPSAVIEYLANKAGTIKGRGRAGTAPHIGIPHIFVRLRDHGRKGFIL